VEFITHDLDKEARGTITFVIRGVCVVIGWEEVRWNVTCGLGSKVEEGQLVKVGAQVLCRLKRSRRWRSSRAM